MVIAAAWIVLCGLAGVLPACDGPGIKPPAGERPVPSPIDTMLPWSINIHPLSGTRAFDDPAGAQGIEARIEARDVYGDTTKAFGDFRFELYEFVPNSPKPKGRRLAMWSESVVQPEANLRHWDSINRWYVFKLQCYEPLPPGKQFVLSVVFSSPFTQRLFKEKTIVSGQ